METNYKRWSDPRSTWGSQHPARAKFVGRVIDKLAPSIKTKTILDLGCGDQILRRNISNELQYIPADIYKRSSDCITLDLNKNEYPDNSYGVISAIGVIEYLNDVNLFFSSLSTRCEALVCTYSPAEGNPGKHPNWHNYMTNESFLSIALRYFELRTLFRMHTTQSLFVFRPGSSGFQRQNHVGT